MNPDYIRTRIGNLKAEIAAASVEITHLQTACTHPRGVGSALGGLRGCEVYCAVCGEQLQAIWSNQFPADQKKDAEKTLNIPIEWEKDFI